MRVFRFGRWWDCWPQVPAWVPGGRWIPYGAAAVALHRAARLVCVALPLAGAVGPSVPPAVAAPPVVVAGWPVGGAGLYLPGEEGLLPWQPSNAAQLSGFDIPVATPEPGALTLLLMSAGALIAINEGRRQAMRKYPRVTQFTGWPPPPPRIEPLLEDDELSGAKALLAGLAIGSVIWCGLLLICAWHWGLL